MSNAGPKAKIASSPFAALAALRDALPQGPPSADEAIRPAATPAKPSTASSSTLGEKLVVSRSKKGRGGKTVTTIAGVHDEAAREALALELRRALGCGASVDEALIVVQGDQVPRVRALLEARGVRKIILGA
jgi:translation initiation factor 1